MIERRDNQSLVLFRGDICSTSRAHLFCSLTDVSSIRFDGCVDSHRKTANFPFVTEGQFNLLDLYHDYTHTHMHAHMHARMHAHMHARTCTHKHEHGIWQG